MDVHEYLNPVMKGKNAGILSEAGCPGIADPGSILVKMAHSKGIRVEPLVGPSSILLALMASGFNGQQFAFHGYLPIDQKDRSRKIKELERESSERNQTQIFMEAPHRNNELLQAILKEGNSETKLCIACDITLETEFIQTKSLGDWKAINSLPDLHKRPCIFIIYSK